MLLGVVLVLAGIGRYLPAGLGEEDAARVGDATIAMDDWRRAVDAANAGRRVPLDAAGESAVLDVLVDQELLLQLSDRLGLSRSLPTVRGQLVQAAMDSLAESARDPSEQELREFVAEDPARFTTPERRRIRAWRHESSADARAGLRGEPIDVPSTPLAQLQLQRWLGETLAGRVFDAAGEGVLPEPLAVGQGWYRIEVIEVLPAAAPAFEDLDADLVRREWTRREQERALASALESLREEAGVRVREPR